MSRLSEAVRTYLTAERDMHYTASSTDVHGHGGVAGQALTPHCIHICNVTGNRVERTPEGGMRVIPGTPPHQKEREAYEDAWRELQAALAEEDA